MIGMPVLLSGTGGGVAFKPAMATARGLHANDLAHRIPGSGHPSPFNSVPEMLGPKPETQVFKERPLDTQCSSFVLGEPRSRTSS